MAFKRSEAVVEAVALETLSAGEVERRIIAGVRKYATNQANWTKADKNTPFLGNLIGMGIESANLVDITMSIERQFLTRMTHRVPLPEDPGKFRFEKGEPGPLMILEGQDIHAATPGLAVKMLMDAGHMPRDAGYLLDVVSFAYIVVVGEAYRLNDTLRKTLRKLPSAADPAARQEIAANVKTLVTQALSYAEALADPAAVARSRREAYHRERSELQGLETQLEEVTAKLKDAALSDDTGVTDRLRSQQVSLRLKLNANRTRLRVAEEVANHSGQRIPVEEQKVADVRRLLLESAQEAEGALDPQAANA